MLARRRVWSFAESICWSSYWLKVEDSPAVADDGQSVCGLGNSLIFTRKRDFELGKDSRSKCDLFAVCELTSPRTGLSTNRPVTGICC